jgi:hypothetical protein
MISATRMALDSRHPHPPISPRRPEIFLGHGVAAGAVVLAQATGPTRAELDALGPQVGQLAPDFTLPDQHGQPHRLSSLLGPKGALLVFFRSADW